MQKVIEINDKLIDRIIDGLNRYGREVDNCEYGLPIDSYGSPEEQKQMNEMRDIVRNILINN